MLPIIPLSTLTRQPNKVLNSNNPYDVLMSHNTPKAVILKVNVFEKLSKTPIWREICEEWWEAHDPETIAVVKKGKQMKKTGNYQKAVPFGG